MPLPPDKNSAAGASGAPITPTFRLLPTNRDTTVKRDMDAIRRILTAIEAGTEPYMRFIEKDEVYNVVLLADAGLVKAHFREVPGRGIVAATVERMTWSGHEFLDAIRDDAVWTKAKETVMRPGVSWTFPQLMDFLEEEVRARVTSARPA